MPERRPKDEPLLARSFTMQVAIWIIIILIIAVLVKYLLKK
jgi:hypothetical protein